MNLNAEQIIQKLRSNKKIQDYSLVICFFLAFSVFLWFAIRPNLITAFSLQQELTELREKDAHYEEVILSIVEFQSKLENNRDNLYLLDEALPEKPHVYKMVTDIYEVASQSGLRIERMDLQEVELLDSDEALSDDEYENDDMGMDMDMGGEEEEEIEDDMGLDDTGMEDEFGEETPKGSTIKQKEYTIILSSQSSQEYVDAFVNNLMAQRRLKIIRQMVYNSEQSTSSQGSSSATMRVEFEIKGSYL